jgi:hypothetical protein
VSYPFLKGNPSLDDIPEDGPNYESEEQGTNNVAPQNLNYDVESVAVPYNWSFDGFGVFLLWGPTRPPNKSLNLIYTDKAATGRKADLSRASAGKEEAQSKSKARVNNVD